MSKFKLVFCSVFVIAMGLSGCLKDDDEIVSESCTEGESRYEDCNECVCNDGEWLCSDLDCDARPCEPDECGPRPAIPDQVCFDGTSAGIGDCARSENGTCGWTRTECPPECEPGDELEHFNGNNCICSGAGEYECICEGNGPAPDCQCLSDGTWACPGGPAMCAESDACNAYFDSCNCSWSCSTSEPPPGECDVVCGDTGAMPACDCVDGNCRALDGPVPPTECGENGGSCDRILDSCSCEWMCTNDAASMPQCDQECPESEVPSFTCECTEGGCDRVDEPTVACDDGFSCSPYYSSCSCSWTCLGSDEDPAECDQLCAPDDTPAPMCECTGDTCSVAAACQDGETREADDGCNTCRCLNGEWACTLIACPPEMCRDGETREAEDGCNTCTCFDNQWACTELACPMECTAQECGPGLGAPTRMCDDGSTAGPECVRDRTGECGWIITRCPESESYEPCADKVCGDSCQLCDPADSDCVETREAKVCNQAGECVSDAGDLCPGPLPPIPPWLVCAVDTDCMPSGCGGEMCASEPQVSVCVALPEHACYRNGITSCGCVNGACGWSNRVELDMCIEEARGNGGQPIDGDREEP
jgi:hypothetical protein